MSDAVSDAGSGAGGSGARLEGSGKRQSTGGGEEGTGDSTAESGPRTEQSWTEYLTELRGAMNKAVDMTEQAKGNRTYMTEAKRAVQALRTKARSAPPLHPNLEGFRAEPVSDSVEKSSVLADACDYVLNLLGSALLNVVEIAKASQAMRILCREADQTVTRELHLVNEPVTLIPTPPRPDLVQQSEGANPGETVGDQLRKDKWPAQTSAQNPAPEISPGVFQALRRSPRTRSQAPADGSGRPVSSPPVSQDVFKNGGRPPSSPDTTHARPTDPTLMVFVGKGKAFFSELVVRTMKCKRKTVTHGGRCKNEARPGRKTCAIHARGVHHVARSCGMHVARTKETKRKYDDMATGIPSAPATVADAVRLSWLSRFPGQTGAPTQEEAKKGK
eukprot:jgi/Mesvir1/15492/Mv20025-RA.1